MTVCSWQIVSVGSLKSTDRFSWLCCHSGIWIECLKGVDSATLPMTGIGKLKSISECLKGVGVATDGKNYCFSKFCIHLIHVDYAKSRHRK